MSVITQPLRGQTVSDDAPLRSQRDWHLAEWSMLFVAIAYGAGQFQVWRIKLGWDESIYLSQVSRSVPAAFFSAPRARGITWLAEPLAMFTSSVPALRIYLTVLSALAFYVAFRIWFKVLPGFAVVIAAALFGSLWISRFYGASLMPNLWVAFGVLAAVGGYLRVVAHPARTLTSAASRERSGSDTDTDLGPGSAHGSDAGPTHGSVPEPGADFDGSRSLAPAPPTDLRGAVALVLGLALAAVMRPSDAAWAVAPLLVATAAVPAWRRILRVWLLILVGAGLGAAPWIIEADQRFGGVRARLRTASDIQGGLGWHLSALAQHWQTLNGPLLCRPCSVPSTPPFNTVWFVLLPVAALAAIFVARRTAALRTAIVLVPAVVGLSVSVPYLLLINYSAPRFLLPGFALLCLPVGALVHRLLLTADGFGVYRYLMFALLAVALGTQVVSQQRIMDVRVTAAAVGYDVYGSVAARLGRLGVHAPCVISGTQSPPFAYYAGCSSRNVGGHDGSITAQQVRALASKETVVLLRLSTGRRPAGIRSWTRHDLQGPSSGPTWVGYISPAR